MQKSAQELFDMKILAIRSPHSHSNVTNLSQKKKSEISQEPFPQIILNKP